MWECKLSLELSGPGDRAFILSVFGQGLRERGEAIIPATFYPLPVQATLFQESRAVGVRSKKYMEGVLERRVARNILIPNANASPSAHSLHAQGSSGARRV